MVCGARREGSTDSLRFYRGIGASSDRLGRYVIASIHSVYIVVLVLLRIRKMVATIMDYHKAVSLCGHGHVVVSSRKLFVVASQSIFL